MCVSQTGDYLELGGNPFFYLADTVWMAFSKLSLDEWTHYLDTRKEQGFNVLQISLLPITHDNSVAEDELRPFGTGEDGSTDFMRYNEAYFIKADKMLEEASRRGFVPCIHLFWVDYVPDTWAAKHSSGMVMPIEAVRPLTEYVVERFRKFCPIYSISGDTVFETDRVCRYYLEAFDVVKEKDSEGLTTLHLSPYAHFPEVFRDCEMLDFYTFQGCHFQEKQYLNYTQTGQFLRMKQKPIINSEPPYEGHGHGFRYGRFGKFDIRKAVWQSLLSGAKAGVAYGAHGIWSCHVRGQVFTNIEFSGTPFAWRDALKFEGATEAVYAKELFMQEELYLMAPSDLVLNDEKEIRMMSTGDLRRFAVYMPYADELKIGRDLTNYDFRIVNLESREISQPEVRPGEFVSVIGMYDFNGDALILGTNRQRGH